MSEIRPQYEIRIFDQNANYNLSPIAVMLEAKIPVELLNMASRIAVQRYDGTTVLVKDIAQGIDFPSQRPAGSYKCPFCAVISYYSRDLEERYCGKCKRFALDVIDEMRLFADAVDLNSHVWIPTQLYRALQDFENTQVWPLKPAVLRNAAAGEQWSVQSGRLRNVVHAYHKAHGTADGLELGQTPSQIITVDETDTFQGRIIDRGQYRLTRLS